MIHKLNDDEREHVIALYREGKLTLTVRGFPLPSAVAHKKEARS
jgi:hypothetical protein